MALHSNPAPLDYFINNKSDILICTVSGVLNRSNVDALEACIAEVEKAGAKQTLFNLEGVTKIEKSALPLLGRLQRIGRASGWFQMCGIEPEVLQFLKREGMIRSDEVSADLTTALRKLATLR